MVLAADYPLLNVIWTMLVFFGLVIWFWILIRVLADVFRRQDIGGWTKALWIVLMLVLPLLGVLIYLIANGDEMGKRDVKEAQAQQARFDDYVRSVAPAANGGGAAGEIDKAKRLLDDGTITQSEFDSIKARALAGQS